MVDLDRENDNFTAFVDVALQAYSPPRTQHKLDLLVCEKRGIDPFPSFHYYNIRQLLQDPGLIIERAKFGPKRPPLSNENNFFSFSSQAY